MRVPLPIPPSTIPAALLATLLPGMAGAVSLTATDAGTDSLPALDADALAEAAIDLPFAGPARGTPAAATLSITLLTTFDGTWFGDPTGELSGLSPEDYDPDIRFPSSGDFQVTTDIFAPYLFSAYLADPSRSAALSGGVTVRAGCELGLAPSESCTDPVSVSETLTLDLALDPSAITGMTPGDTFTYAAEAAIDPAHYTADSGYFDGDLTTRLSGTVTYDYAMAPVPLPAGLPLLLGGLAGLGLLRRRA